MKRPLWFRRYRFGWTPCAWQGWLLILAFILCLLGSVFCWAPTAPMIVVLVSLALIVLLVTMAWLTDDTHRPES